MKLAKKSKTASVSPEISTPPNFKFTFILILAAFIFSVCARLYWVAWASDMPSFFHNGELMISTNDGYAFAEGARDMLAGFHQDNDLSLVGSSLSALTYWIVKILGVSIETAMIYMSVFFSSFLVVPVLLIAHEYRALKAGFIAALIASVANSYYNRTMAGYYDTDMLTIVLPMFMIWGLVRFVEHKDVPSMIIAPISILAYAWWYPSSSFSLIAASVGLFLLYVLAFERRNLLAYAQFALLLIAMSGAEIWLRALFLALFYTFLSLRPAMLNLKILVGVLVAALAVFIAYGGLNPIIFQLKFYLFRSVSDSGGVNFHYFNVNQTIQESGIVDIVMFCQRISGHVITFALSIVGIALLCVKHRSFVLNLAMLALGFLALKGGLRFTIYAVPAMALGFGYLVVFLADKFTSKGALREALAAFAGLLALLPIGIHIYEYEATPVFSDNEVAVLEKLKTVANREDYVLAWWDYGYPIRYYADVKTLIDGGKHLGQDNYAVSFALGENQTRSANMARFEVEYTERNFKEKFGSNLAQILSDRDIKDVSEFLKSLDDKNLTLPPKTREIYYYLPERMSYIFPTVMQFSRIDLKDGASLGEGLFYVTTATSTDKNGINLRGGFSLSGDGRTLLFGGSQVAINSYFETSYEDGKLVVKQQVFEPAAQIYVVYMRDYGRFLLLDESMFWSTYVQLFVLERFDSDLFEPIILDKTAKIYKLKR